MDGQVSEELKRERIEELIEVVQRSAAARNADRVGGVEEVLVEGPSRTDPAVLRGRTPPEHDRELHRHGGSGRARSRPDRRRHLDDPARRAGRPRRGLASCTRDLVWDGCINVRDLGGLPTEDGGQTAFGSVIRADTLGLLTREGWEALLASGVTRIVDLREQFEIDNDPPRDLDVEVVHVPVLDHYDEERWLEIQAESEAAPTHSAATEIVYLRFLEHCRPRLVEAFEAVATAPGPVVFHCHAGKDRTGLLAALLLRLAGVPIEDIADDYAISRIRLQPRHEPVARLGGERRGAGAHRADHRHAGGGDGGGPRGDRPRLRRRRDLLPPGAAAVAPRERSRPLAGGSRCEAIS